ncbi:MAG: hypothetical protein U9R57_00940 [Thermodesulfobacteriota bacterium]|nr:hypothetical protein [Thermodesulfobacteriota bacterium]
MKSVCWAIVFFLLSSCARFQPAGLPELSYSKPADTRLSRSVQQSCESTFFKGYYQFVHSIVFQMAQGHGATVIGVTVLDGDTLKTGLMGVEGFVLFEAVLSGDKQFEVSRALPPFDRPEFASGLMRDVQIIFHAPSDKNPCIGNLADGASVCRYVEDKDQIIDVILHDDGSRSIKSYDASHSLGRSIAIGPRIAVNGEMIPETLKLIAHGSQGYTLQMTLISSEKIDKQTDNEI